MSSYSKMGGADPHGEKLSADAPAAKQFVDDDLPTLLEKLKPENIYIGKRFQTVGIIFYSKIYWLRSPFASVLALFPNPSGVCQNLTKSAKSDVVKNANIRTLI